MERSSLEQGDRSGDYRNLGCGRAPVYGLAFSNLAMDYQYTRLLGGNNACASMVIRFVDLYCANLRASDGRTCTQVWFARRESIRKTCASHPRLARLHLRQFSRTEMALAIPRRGDPAQRVLSSVRLSGISRRRTWIDESRQVLLRLLRAICRAARRLVEQHEKQSDSLHPTKDQKRNLSKGRNLKSASVFPWLLGAKSPAVAAQPFEAGLSPRELLFAATKLPHLQQQFLSLLILLLAAIRILTNNKKGRPDFSERPSFSLRSDYGLVHSAHARFVRPA